MEFTVSIVPSARDEHTKVDVTVVGSRAGASWLDVRRGVEPSQARYEVIDMKRYIEEALEGI